MCTCISKRIKNEVKFNLSTDKKTKTLYSYFPRKLNWKNRSYQVKTP